LLERRLRTLSYHLPGVNKRYDKRTADAVLAFAKVQHRKRRSTVDAGVWHALASPRRPAVHSRKRGIHIEVNQSVQILTVVRNGTVEAILHVSTGKRSTPTRNGRFRVYRKLAGYSGNRLYYPSYFDGLRAIHGWPQVPAYADSHGCVRIPMWSAKWMFRITRIGMRVLVYR
jgi:lipoprotein-anchoring transpeptidase ErfK/SrfK